MAFPYIRHSADWKDANSATGGGDTSTPLTATALDTIEAGIDSISNILELVDAAGDLIVGSGDNAHVRLAKGADDTSLSVSAGALSWRKIVNAMVDAAAAIAVSKLAPSATAGDVLTTVAGVPTWQPPSGAPAGSIMAFGGSSAPAGWLLCDGATATTASQPGLFAVIGYTYGGAGANFTLPDLRGRIPVGRGTNAAVDTLGENEGVAEANRRPQHRHAPHSHSVTTYFQGAAGGIARTAGDSALNSGSTTSVDGGSGNANDSLDAPAYIVLNYIIKT